MDLGHEPPCRRQIHPEDQEVWVVTFRQHQRNWNDLLYISWFFMFCWTLPISEQLHFFKTATNHSKLSFSALQRHVSRTSPFTPTSGGACAQPAEVSDLLQDVELCPRRAGRVGWHCGHVEVGIKMNMSIWRAFFRSKVRSQNVQLKSTGQNHVNFI